MHNQSLRADERREHGAGAPTDFSRVARVAGHAQEGSAGGGGVCRPAWRDMRRSQVSLSLTRAAAVSQAVQGHVTNGDDAVRVPFPARVARSSRCGGSR